VPDSFGYTEQSKKCPQSDRRNHISGSLNLPELIISQGFRLLKSLTSGKIKWIRMRLGLFRIQSNLFYRGPCNIPVPGSVVIRVLCF